MFIGLWHRQKTHPLQSTRRNFRVLPNDLDINIHLNNGRYLSFMDLARLDYMAKVGFLRPTIRNRWVPVVGCSQLLHLKPLNPFQNFEIETRLIFWDEKWFVVQQEFWVGTKCHAVGRIKGMLQKGKKAVPPAEVLASAGHFGIQSPALTEDIRQWMKSSLAERAGFKA